MSQCSREEPVQTGVGGMGVGGVLPAPGLHPSTALSQHSFSWRPRPAVPKTIPPPPRLPALEQRGSAWDGETSDFAGGEWRTGLKRDVAHSGPKGRDGAGKGPTSRIKALVEYKRSQIQKPALLVCPGRRLKPRGHWLRLRLPILPSLLGRYPRA